MEDQDFFKYLRIRAADGTLVPFELNEVQRAILLKARQMRTCPPHVAFRLITAKVDEMQGGYVLADDHFRRWWEESHSPSRWRVEILGPLKVKPENGNPDLP